MQPSSTTGSAIVPKLSRRAAAWSDGNLQVLLQEESHLVSILIDFPPPFPMMKKGVMELVKNLLRDDIPEKEHFFHVKQ